MGSYLGTTFADWLREARKESGRKTKPLAEAAGLSQPYVSMLEKGERDPSRETVKSLAAALGMEPGPGLRAAGFVDDESKDLEYIPDDDEMQLIRFLRGIPPEDRKAAVVGGITGMRTAADFARELREGNTVGKRADRNEDKTEKEQTRGDDVQ